MASYYLAHVKVTESAATKIMIDATGQGGENSKKYFGMRNEESD